MGSDRDHLRAFRYVPRCPLHVPYETVNTVNDANSLATTYGVTFALMPSDDFGEIIDNAAADGRGFDENLLR